MKTARIAFHTWNIRGLDSTLLPLPHTINTGDGLVYKNELGQDPTYLRKSLWDMVKKKFNLVTEFDDKAYGSDLASMDDLPSV